MDATAFAALPGEERLARLSDLARSALERFGLAPDSRLALLHHRENAVFRVEDAAAGALWVLRVHRHGYRSRAEIRSELAWIEALRDAGLHTAVPRRGIDGNPVQTVAATGVPGPLDVDLLSWIDGIPLGLGDMAEAHRLLGRTSAFIQRHGRSWGPPPWFRRPLLDEEGLFGERAMWGRFADLELLEAEDLTLFSRVRDVLARRLGAFGKGPDRFGLTHGDLMADNVLVENGVPHVIDFDDCGYSWFLYDLATLLAAYVGSPELEPVRNAWVEGYRMLEPLPDAHLAEVDALVMARLLLGLGWLHTRRETAMARENGAMIVMLARVQAEKVLGAP